MNIRININKNFCFSKKNTIRINGNNFDNYSVFPKLQGVYIFHLGPIDKIWSASNKILYIGATNREKLPMRIKKNAMGKTLKPIIDKINNRPIYVSYYDFKEMAPDYLPFLLEGYLIKKYEKKFGKLPLANKGRR